MARLLSIRSAVVVFAIGLCAAWPAGAVGAVMVSLNNPGSTSLHEISVAPGETFDVDVNLNTSMQVVGVACQVRASTSGIFDLLQNAAELPWYPGGQVGGLDPAKPVGWYLPEPDVFAPGATTLARLQVSVDPSAASGDYHLNLVDIEAQENRLVMGWTGGGSGPALVVHIVPEPWGFVLVSAFILLTGRRV